MASSFAFCQITAIVDNNLTSGQSLDIFLPEKLIIIISVEVNVLVSQTNLYWITSGMHMNSFACTAEEL